MRLINNQNFSIWDKEVCTALTIRELQIIEDCIGKTSYNEATKDYKHSFKTEPPYSDSDLLPLYKQIQEILKEEGGYITL